MWIHLISDDPDAYIPMQWAWMDPGLVAISVCIAVVTSIMAMHMASLARSRSATAASRRMACTSGAMSLSGGIWCMHFIGMLAFTPCASGEFSGLQSMLSVLPSLAAAWVTMRVLQRPQPSKRALVCSGLFLGLGVAVMHFWGMAAAHSSDYFYYAPSGLLWALALVMGMAVCALLLFRQLQERGLGRLPSNILSGVALGAAVSGMHYIAMDAIHLPIASSNVLQAPVQDHWALVASTAVVCLLLVGVISAVNIAMRWRQLFERSKRSESRFRAVVDTAVDGIIMIEGNGTISSFNPAAEKLLGWTAQEVIGRNVSVLMPEPDQSAHDGYLHRHLQTGHTSIIGSGRDVNALHKNGELIAVRLAVGRVSSPDQPLFVGFLTDMRQRRSTEASLRRSEEQHRTLISNMPGVTFRRDPNALWHPLFLSKAVEALTGWPAEALLSQPSRMASMLLPAEVAALSAVVQEAMQNGTAYSHEYRLRDRDGRIHWVTESGRGVHDAEGKLQWIDGVLIDNTEAKARNAEFEGTVKAINRAMAVIEYSMDGLVLTANQNFLDIFGYELRDVQGQHFRMFCLDNPQTYETDDAIWLQLQQGHFVTQECQAVAQDGRLLWVQTSFNPILDASGKPLRVTQLLTDSTARHTLAQDLMEAKNRAEAAAAARSTFLANMSHEIRTPMNAIIGFSEALLETPLRPTQARHLETVHRSARSMLRLLNDILDTAKLDKGAVSLEIDDFALVDVCNLVVSAQRMEAEKKGLQLQLEVAERVPFYLRGDALRVQQILTNLMGNAVKFTERGAVQLTVDYEGETLHLWVRDTGIGIAAEKLERIFDPFAQADASTTRRYGGTGLGTTISRQLAELMGGKIVAHSVLGEGSEFHVQLRLQQGQAPRSNAAALVQPMRPLHILAADDVPQNLELLDVVLGKYGHSVVMAHDGVEALQLRQSQHFDVVLMDLQMPLLDGLSATRAIRAWEQAQQAEAVPIIALSASVLDQDRRSAFDAGMDGFATKPLEVPALLAEIHRVMQATGYEAAAPALASAHEVAAPLPMDGSVVDWAAGLALWGGRSALRTAWTRFMAEHAQCVAAFEALQQQGDWQAVRAAVHRMRGAAGNLALLQLYAVLTMLESAAQLQEEERFVTLLPQLAEALTQVETLLRLSAAPAEEDAPARTRAASTAWTPLEKAAALAVLDEMEQALQSGEIPATALQQLPRWMERAQWTAMEASIEIFDFDQALHQLQVLRTEIEALTE